MRSAAEVARLFRKINRKSDRKFDEGIDAEAGGESELNALIPVLFGPTCKLKF